MSCFVITTDKGAVWVVWAVDEKAARDIFKRKVSHPIIASIIRAEGEIDPPK